MIMLFKLSLVLQEGSADEALMKLVKTYEGSRFGTLGYNIEHKNMIN